VARRRISVPWRRIKPGTWSVYVGLITCAGGFALLALAWGKVAGELNVSLQVPYIVSAAFTGLGLIMVGLTVVLVATNRAGSETREALLREIITELQAARLSKESVEDADEPMQP
jgi:hypothetical protein